MALVGSEGGRVVPRQGQRERPGSGEPPADAGAPALPLQERVCAAPPRPPLDIL